MFRTRLFSRGPVCCPTLLSAQPRVHGFLCAMISLFDATLKQKAAELGLSTVCGRQSRQPGFSSDIGWFPQIDGLFELICLPRIFCFSPIASKANRQRAGRIGSAISFNAMLPISTRSLREEWAPASAAVRPPQVKRIAQDAFYGRNRGL